MAITIGQVEAPKYTNTFVAELRFMHGDADHYSTMEITLADEAELRAFVETIAHLDAIDPHYHRLGDYDHTWEQTRVDPLYARFFRSFSLADYEQECRDDARFKQRYPTHADALRSGWGEDEWPRDEHYHHGPAALESVSYFWYDELGRRSPVTIEGEA